MSNPADARGTELYRGHEIHVHAERNARGAWMPEIALYRNGSRIDCSLPEPVEPDWLTEEEALREGFERGRYWIDHGGDVD
ncbi:DUF6566 family protein [Burkholderia gladioli]|uniref:DUF6566 family protein n=1 Tax=Burkholderia gladioli TaxID=28095 RepID=UPI003D1AF3AD